MSSVAVFSKASPFDALQRWLPKLVLAPSMFIVLVGFYGYILWTFVLSFTTSTFLPSYNWAGLAQYERLFDNDRWWVASKNLALFGGMFIGITLVIGVLLAVFLDQRIRRVIDVMQGNLGRSLKVDELARELNLDPLQIVKLASNENPLGPSPRVLEAIGQALGELTRYPDGNGFALMVKCHGDTTIGGADDGFTKFNRTHPGDFHVLPRATGGTKPAVIRHVHNKLRVFMNILA